MDRGAAENQIIYPVTDRPQFFSTSWTVLADEAYFHFIDLNETSIDTKNYDHVIIIKSNRIKR